MMTIYKTCRNLVIKEKEEYFEIPSSGFVMDYLPVIMCCMFNSLRPSDAIWRHKFGTTLAVA